MKVFANGSEDYGNILKRLMNLIDHSLYKNNLQFKNEERHRLRLIMDFIKIYGTANRIDHNALKVLMRVSFCRKEVSGKVLIMDEAQPEAIIKKMSEVSGDSSYE